MAWTKAKTAIVVGAAIILAGGTATLAMKKFSPPPQATMEIDGSFWNSLSTENLQKAPPILLIRPTKDPKMSGYVQSGDGERLMGLNQSLDEMFVIAYRARFGRTVYPPKLPGELPKERFDFLINLPSGGREAFRAELKKRFGLSAKREMREMDVMLLKIKTPNAAGLKISKEPYGKQSSGKGNLSMRRLPITALAGYLEYAFKKPVLDRTGLTNYYDIELNWANGDTPAQIEPLKKVLADQLGLDLVPSVESIETLIVERAKN